jgi:hypothetical protein
MIKGEEIAKAIGSHGLWKAQLEKTIETGRSNFTVETARRDDACDFGKWLSNLRESEKKSVQWKNVKTLHAAFHQEAAIVLAMALNGEKEKALKAMADESPFMNCSADLISAMMVLLNET